MSTPVTSLPSVARASHEEDRVALSKDAFKHAFLDNLFYIQGKFPALATKIDYYMALAYAVRDRIMQRWISTASAYTKQGSRTVSYLSAEFLMGPHLGNNLINLDIYETARTAVAELGLDLEELLAHEDEPGLGNGGLGRLAACFIDSLATLEVPALGYGIRYEFGIFQQEIVDGWQVEKTDKWLRYGNPWEIARPEWCCEVKFGGHTEVWYDEFHRKRTRWVPGRIVNGIPYDTPILGYHVNTANTLRLWKAEAPESFDFGTFNRGDYYGAVNQKVASENLTKVLYPNDEQVRGKELRLEQQYFFVSCSLQDMLRICKVQKIPPERFHEKFAVQMNDTHPSVAVAELMRLLIDEMAVDWERAWSITRQTFGYTNHTLLPEALERWPVGMFGKLLPRLLEIIYEINARFLDEVRMAFFGDEERIKRLSLIDEVGRALRAHGAPRQRRQPRHQWRGAAALRSAPERRAQAISRELWPEKFSNKTNGVTPRRWMVLANPRLAHCITQRIGDEWIRDLSLLRKLEPLVEDADFRAEWRQIKHANKATLAGLIEERTGVVVNPAAIFDVQVKRIHEYKRQHLNILHVIGLYHRLKTDPKFTMEPRVFVFGGKAAPGYYLAKLIIRLITAAAEIINRDPGVRELIKVVLPAELQRHQRPAHLPGGGSLRADLHRGQGSLRHRQHEVPDEWRAHHRHGGRRQHRDLRRGGRREFLPLRSRGARSRGQRAMGYRPMEYLEANEELQAVIQLIRDGFFSRGNSTQFLPLIDNLVHHDPYFVMADYQSYADCQALVDQCYRDKESWTRMSILNAARSGKFSSDRTIREYCNEIWYAKPVRVQLLSQEEVKAGLLQ